MAKVSYTTYFPVEIVFRMLEPLTKGDERRPGEVFVPIQISIYPIHAVLQEAIRITVTAVGGTATGKFLQKLWSCDQPNLVYMAWCTSLHLFSKFRL